MSQVIEQADELRSKAIEILVAERGRIDERLSLLGYDGAPIASPAKKERACGTCGGTGHTSRACPGGKTADHEKL